MAGGSRKIRLGNSHIVVHARLLLQNATETGSLRERQRERWNVMGYIMSLRLHQKKKFGEFANGADGSALLCLVCSCFLGKVVRIYLQNHHHHHHHHHFLLILIEIIVFDWFRRLSQRMQCWSHITQYIEIDEQEHFRNCRCRHQVNTTEIHMW